MSRADHRADHISFTPMCQIASETLKGKGEKQVNVRNNVPKNIPIGESPTEMVFTTVLSDDQITDTVAL